MTTDAWPSMSETILSQMGEVVGVGYVDGMGRGVPRGYVLGAGGRFDDASIGTPRRSEYAHAKVATHTPLSGRARECAVLDGLLDAVRTGESRALVVSGEAGRAAVAVEGRWNGTIEDPDLGTRRFELQLRPAAQ